MMIKHRTIYIFTSVSGNHIKGELVGETSDYWIVQEENEENITQILKKDIVYCKIAASKEKTGWDAIYETVGNMLAYGM